MLKFKIRVSTGLSPSEGYEGGSVTCFLRSSYWFADKSLAFLVFAATPWRQPSSTHAFSCVCVSKFPFAIRTPVV